MRRCVAPAVLAAAVIGAGLAGCAAVPRAPAALPAEAHDAPDRFVVITVRDRGGADLARAGSTPRGYDSIRAYGASAAARERAATLARDYRLREVSSWPIAALSVHCLVYRLPDEADPARTLAALGRDPRVESAEPLQTFSTLESRYNDAYRPLQRNIDQLAIEAAHGATRGAGVRVAVIDTGIDVTHPDLDGRRIVQRNFVPSPADSGHERHGTEVAGVIAAVANNRRGIAGIAPDATIHSLRACWHPGPGVPATCDSFTLAQALAAALDLRADVINLSLAGPSDALLARLVAIAVHRGAVVVAAVAPGDPPGRFPARLPGVLAVDVAESGTSRADVLHAPGREIPTLVPGDAYDFASGSSLAAAEVAATAALLRAARPGMPGEQIAVVLRTTSSELLGADAGGPSIDACRALASVTRGADCASGQARVAAGQSRAAAAHPRRDL